MLAHVGIVLLLQVWPARGSAGPKVAVANMTLAVPACECFGLLGTNGAGDGFIYTINTEHVDLCSLWCCRQNNYNEHADRGGIATTSSL